MKKRFRRIELTKEGKMITAGAVAAIVLLALLLVVRAYVAYVFLSYHRIEDNLSLTPEGHASASVRTGTPYTVVS